MHEAVTGNAVLPTVNMEMSTYFMHSPLEPWHLCLTVDVDNSAVTRMCFRRSLGTPCSRCWRQCRTARSQVSATLNGTRSTRVPTSCRCCCCDLTHWPVSVDTTKPTNLYLMRWLKISWKV